MVHTYTKEGNACQAIQRGGVPMETEKQGAMVIEGIGTSLYSGKKLGKEIVRILSACTMHQMAKCAGGWRTLHLNI